MQSSGLLLRNKTHIKRVKLYVCLCIYYNELYDHTSLKGH